MTRDVLLKTLRELSGPTAQNYSDDDLLYRTANEYKNQGRLGEIPALENEFNRINAEIEADGRGFFGDVYAAGKRGLGQLKQNFNVVQGAEDPTNAQDIADAQKTIDLNPISSELREFQSVAKDDALGWLTAFAKNPVTITTEVIAESLASSLPSMVGGMVIGGAKGALGLNPATAAAGAAAGAFTGSYATERASKILDVMREKGMDPNDPASIQSFFNDPEKLAEARDLANKRAIPVALFDAATFGLAGRFMRPLKAAKAAGEKVAFSRVLGATGKEIGVQASGGMLGELGGQVASGEEIDPRSIFLEGIAEVGSAPAEIRSNLSDIRATKKAEAPAAQPYTEENEAATTAKAAFQADIPVVNTFFTAPAEAMQAAAAAEAGVAPTVESIVAKVMAGNTNLTPREVEYASIPEVSDQIKAVIESKTEQIRTEAAQKAALKSARKPGDQMRFGETSVIEASRTVGEPVIGEIDSTPGDEVPVEDAPGQETLNLLTDKQVAAIQAKEALQATKEKAKADKITAAEQSRLVREKAAELRSRVVRVPRSEFRAEAAPTPAAPDNTIPFPVDAAAKRVRERAALVRNADDAEFIDFTTGETMDVPLAAAPDTTVPFAPATTTPVEPVAEKPTVTSTSVAAATPPTETTPAPVSAPIPSADDLVESSLNLPADIKTVKERVEGLLAAVAEKADGSVHLLPLVRGEDGVTYVKQISNFENKGALVDALAESYAGQKGFSKPSLRKLIINEAPFTADGKVNQEQMLRLYGNPATRAKWTPVVQRALDMGVLGVGSKKTKLSEYLAANEMVSSGTAAVTKTPLKNPTRISSPLESVTAKARTEPAMTDGDAVNTSAIAAKLPKKRVGQVVERLSLEKVETLEQINALLVSKPEEAQAEIDRIIGVVKGDTPKYRVSLFVAGNK